MWDAAFSVQQITVLRYRLSRDSRGHRQWRMVFVSAYYGECEVCIASKNVPPGMQRRGDFLVGMEERTE
jgi:hypothetical protein